MKFDLPSKLHEIRSLVWQFITLPPTLLVYQNTIDLFVYGNCISARILNPLTPRYPDIICSDSSLPEGEVLQFCGQSCELLEPAVPTGDLGANAERLHLKPMSDLQSISSGKWEDLVTPFCFFFYHFPRNRNDELRVKSNYNFLLPFHRREIGQGTYFLLTYTLHKEQASGMSK